MIDSTALCKFGSLFVKRNLDFFPTGSIRTRWLFVVVVPKGSKEG